MYLLRMPRWARMEAGQIKGHQFSIVASPINISRTVPSSLYVTQRIPSMIAKNQVFSTNFFAILMFKYTAKLFPRIEIGWDSPPPLQQFMGFCFRRLDQERSDLHLER